MATSTITNTITDPTGSAVASVTVVARLKPGPGFRANATEVAARVTTTTNASGNWSLALERNANITPTGTWWEIEEQIPDAQGGSRVWAISVGASNATLYASLVTPSDSTGLATYITQAAGDARYALTSQLPAIAFTGTTAAALTIAIGNAAAGSTLYCSSNITLEDVVPINKALTLVLGGITVTAAMTDPGQGSGAFYVTANSVTIEGTGETSIITQGAAANVQDAIYLAAGVSGFTLRRLKVDWNDANQTNASGYFTSIKCGAGCKGIRILDNYFTRGGNRAVDLRGSGQIWIARNRFINIGADGSGSYKAPNGSGGNAISVDVTGTTRSHDVEVTDNYFEIFGDTAIGVPNTQRATIKGNIIRGATDLGLTPTGNESGISVNGCTDTTVVGNVVKATYAIGIVGNDQTVIDHYPCQRVAIVANTLYNAPGCQTTIGVAGQVNTSGYSGPYLIADNIIDQADNTTTNALAVGGNYILSVIVKGNIIRVNAVTATQVGIIFSGNGPDNYVVADNLIVKHYRGINIQANVGVNGTVTDNVVVAAHSGQAVVIDNALNNYWNNAGHSVSKMGAFAVIQGAPATAPSSSLLGASEISFYLDEGGANLKVMVKYADGTTVKTGTLAVT